MATIIRGEIHYWRDTVEAGAVPTDASVVLIETWGLPDTWWVIVDTAMRFGDPLSPGEALPLAAVVARLQGIGPLANPYAPDRLIDDAPMLIATGIDEFDDAGLADIRRRLTDAGWPYAVEVAGMP